MDTTTTATTTEIEARVEDALNVYLDDGPGTFSESVLDFLDMDEDAAIEAFGRDLSDRLCDLWVEGDVEWVQTCCVTFECPGGSALSGWVAIRTASGTEVAFSDVTEDGFIFSTWL